MQRSSTARLRCLGRPGARRGGGFTLVGILVALAIAALLATLCLATVQSWLPRLQQQSQARALAEALQLARGEALKRGRRVGLCPTVDQATCDASGRWEAGWLVFDDVDGDGDRDATEPIVRAYPPATAPITVSGNRPVGRYVSYTGYGHTRLVSGALQMGTFTVCRSGLGTIEVVLANGGRPRIQELPAPCP